MGGFQCIPWLYRNYDTWKLSQPEDRDRFQPNLDGLEDKIVKVKMEAGDLLIFNSTEPHGIRPNKSKDKVRIAQYLSMMPAEEDNEELRNWRINSWRNSVAPEGYAFPGDPRNWEQEKYKTAKLSSLGEKLLGLVDYKTEILSGLTVALALVPEAIAFALIPGFSPLTGLYAAFILALITSIFGGRPGMISGATGAVAVIFIGLILELKRNFPGIEPEAILHYVFATVIIAGVLQIGAGLLRLGTDSLLSGLPMYTMLGLTLLTMLIIWGLPKLTKAIPSSLVAIVIVSAIVIGFGVETLTVADTMNAGETIKGGFPPLSIPQIPYTLESLWIILPFAGIVAGVGLIESLLTLNIIDEITETRGSGNRECVAQGTANILSGFLSGMGGCAMIAFAEKFDVQNDPEEVIIDFQESRVADMSAVQIALNFASPAAANSVSISSAKVISLNGPTPSLSISTGTPSEATSAFFSVLARFISKLSFFSSFFSPQLAINALMAKMLSNFFIYAEFISLLPNGMNEKDDSFHHYRYEGLWHKRHNRSH
ncbi:putative sulfate transporter YbaR [Nymphon striatum]|nr:putative sulfate transporter YbaR [Nymphon striatum]